MLEVSFVARDRIVVRSSENPTLVWRSCDPTTSATLTKINNNFYLKNTFKLVAPVTYIKTFTGVLKYHKENINCNILGYRFNNHDFNKNRLRNLRLITADDSIYNVCQEIYIPHVLFNGSGLWCVNVHSFLAERRRNHHRFYSRRHHSAVFDVLKLASDGSRVEY